MKILQWLYNKTISILNFVKDTIIKTIKVVATYGKEVIINAPAVTIMTFSAFGIANVMHNMNLSALFVSIPFINEIAIISVLSVTIVMMLSTLAGKIAERQINY